MVAASNSAVSVTLSGDADAIEEAKEVFEEEKKFARLLKVDKAYHSHHMQPVAEPYAKSLQDCQIQADTAVRPICSWYSSVRGGKSMESCEDLNNRYWIENMLQTVLFTQALENALTHETIDLVLEIGPHAALQGPASQTILDVLKRPLPYQGLLSRGIDDVEALSNTLGYLWSQGGRSTVDLSAVSAHLLDNTVKPHLLVDLPGYVWEHERVFWHESRSSKAFRTRKTAIHEVIGAITDESTTQEARWRNLLRPREVAWLHDHQLQGEIVFPAAGYAVAAIEAVLKMSGARPIAMIELIDLVILRALSFSDENAEVETLTSLSELPSVEDQHEQHYDFKFSHDLGHGSTSLTLSAAAQIKVTYGEYHTDCLPSRASPSDSLNPVDRDHFYSSLRKLGYTYENDFKGLTDMHRKYNFGTAILNKPAKQSSEDLHVHPALLDSAFQAIFLAFAWPGDGRLWSLHVPVGIRSLCVTMSPELASSQESAFVLDSVLIEDPSGMIQGDVSVFDANGENMIIKVEGLDVVPFAPGTSADDVALFSKTVWGPFSFDINGLGFRRATSTENEFASVMERVSYFYLRQLCRDISLKEIEDAEWNHKRIFDYADHCISLVRDHRPSFLHESWDNDTWAEITPLLDTYVWPAHDRCSLIVP